MNDWFLGLYCGVCLTVIGIFIFWLRRIKAIIIKREDDK